MTREEARALADRVLSTARTRDCAVHLSLTADAYTRFAQNQVTTAGAARVLSISVTSREGRRSATVRVAERTPDALERAVVRSAELAVLAPPDPEAVEPLGPQRYPAIAAFDAATAAADAARRLGVVREAIEVARSKDLHASGFLRTRATWEAIANRRGLFGYHARTEASFTTTSRTRDGTGSGWAGAGAPSLAALDARRLAERAAAKALASARPRTLEPGTYTVVLEPEALADLVEELAGWMSARAAEEGRSALSAGHGRSRVGEKIVSDRVTLRSDPFDPRIPATPWTSEWLPARRTSWIERGVLRALPLDRYWAERTGRAPLPRSGGLVLEGGSGTVDELVAGTRRGLLVTRFWYIRTVNPYNLELTGLTRDGVWLVEDGRIAGPVNNFRFNDSPLNLLANVEALAAAESTGRVVVPAVRASGFRLTSRSDAV